MQEQVTDIIQTFVQHLGVSIDTLTYTPLAGQHIYSISTSESKRLIGPQGEHLRALNFILRRYCERIPTLREYKFLVDINGYQVGHIQDVEEKARACAHQVRAQGISVELPPMNSYERMIVHALFTTNTEVETESVGTGATRRIVLKPRGTATVAL
jgi:spoIIIJ-associated protein